MSAKCNYSEKFKPLVLQRFPQLKEGTFSYIEQGQELFAALEELFIDPRVAFTKLTNQTYSEVNPMQDPSSETVEVKDIDQRLNVLQNAKQGSIGTFYVANSNELTAVQRDFKKRLVECSIFSIDYSEASPVWNWVEDPNAMEIGDISKLNKNIIDYKIELINNIRAALQDTTLPLVQFDSTWTDSDFQKIVHDTIRGFENLKTDSTLSDVNFQKLFNNYAVLVNFDEFVNEQVPFVSVKKAYNKLEGLSKYEYRGPNVENYTGFQAGEFAAIESQDSDLAKIILDMIPECDANTGAILEGTSCGLAGFNSGLTVIKRNLLHNGDPDLLAAYFDEGLQFDLQSFIEEFIYKDLSERKNVAGAYDPNRTFLLNKLKGISTILLSENTPIAVKNMFMQMFIKTEAISYRAYTKGDNGLSGKNLKSRFIDSQRAAVEGFIENGIRMFSKPIMKQLLDQFNLTDNKNGSWTLTDGNGVSVTFGVRYTESSYTAEIQNEGINPNVINDLIQVVLQQIVPSDYETCMKHSDDWTFANDYLPLIAAVLNHVNGYGSIPTNDTTGKRDYKSLTSLTIPVASRLSVVYGAETKNVVNSPTGKKLPIYQLTCLAYNVRSLINDYSKIRAKQNAYHNNVLIANPEVLGDPMVRNEVFINGQSKEPSKLTVSELAQLAIIEDFYKELVSGDSVYLQNATFADKGTHFLQEYHLDKVQIDDDTTLKDLVLECTNGNPNVDDRLIEFIRETRASKVNTVVNNILSDYNTVYGMNMTTLDELEAFLKTKKSPAVILNDFNKYNKTHPGANIVFYEEIHSSGKSASVNEMIKNHYRTFNDSELTKKRLNANLQRFAQTIYDEGFELSGFADRTTVDRIVKRYDKATGVNAKFYNSITKKLKFVIKNADGTYEMHPILKAFAYTDILLSNEYNSIAIGEAWCHPNKNKSANISSLTKIISGGQTGVDQIGLKIAKELGFETGGTATPGFATEAGKNLDLKNIYGLTEISPELQAGKRGKQFYLPRTEQNVINSDGTVYFTSDENSGGLYATRGYATTHGKPFIVNPTATQLQDFIAKNKIKTLNVAGNRASLLQNPTEVENTLREAFSMDNYIEFSEASRLIAQIKRSVIFGATIHPYAQHVLDARGVDIGVAENVRVAVIKDMPALARNYIGDEASNDSMDGSGYSHPLQARLENNSLIDNRVGYNKKSIHGDTDPRYGVQKLLKWAVYGITNEVRRNSKGSKASLESLYRKMSDKTFSMSKEDITSALLQSIGNKPIYTYNEDSGVVIMRENWRVEGGDLVYDETIFNEVAVSNGVTFIKGDSYRKSIVPKNLYEVDQLLGGAWSCDAITPGQVIKGVSFNERNLDILEDFVCVNKLKDHFIAYAVNKSAIKTGIGNMNDANVFFRQPSVIWGHPTSGKTTFYKTSSDVIDFDSTFKKRVKQELGIAGMSSEDFWAWRQIGNNEQIWREACTKAFDEGVRYAKENNMTLMVSDLFLLETRANDFDKIYTLESDDFIARNRGRGETDDNNTREWKAGIDLVLNSIVKDKKIASKVVTLKEGQYMSDILDTSLKTIDMSTKYSGIQMDADHELDLAEVTEMTQMISALIEDGHYVELVSEIYDVIGKTVFEQLGDYKQAVDAKDKPALYRILAKSLIESFEGDDKDTLGLAQAFVRKAQAHLNDENIEFVLPFSAQTINGAFIANLASTINKKGIRHKYQGFAGVLNPSYNAIQYYRVFNPNTGKYEVRMYKEFMALCRNLKYTDPTTGEIRSMRYIDSQSNDFRVNRFLTPYKNGRFDIDFEDTVVIYKTTVNENGEEVVAVDDNGKPIVVEEVYVNNYATYDRLKHRYDWTGRVAYNKTSAPKNLKQANTRFEVEQNGIRTVYSLYDTDEVRAQYYLRNLEDALSDGKAIDVYEAAFLLSTIYSDDPTVKTRLYDVVSGSPVAVNVEKEITELFGKNTKQMISAIRSLLQERTQNLTKALDERTSFKLPSFNGGGMGVCINSWTTAPEIIAGRYHGKQFGLTNNDHIFDIMQQKSDFFYKKLSNRYSQVSKEVFGDIFDVTLYHGDTNFAVKVASDEEIQSMFATLPEDTIVSEDTDFRVVGDCYWFENERVAKTKGIKFYRLLRNGQVQKFVTCSDVETYNKFVHSHFFDQFKEYNWTTKNIDMLKDLRFGRSNIVRLYTHPQSVDEPSVIYVNKDQLTVEQLITNEERSRTIRMKELAECQFESFKQQLNYVGARIPTQAMQSFMPMEIIAFTDTEKNEVYVPAAQTWLQGSDYDIDKLYILAHSIDANGVLQMTSDLTKYYPVSLVRELKQPNGIEYTEGTDGYIVDYDTLATIVKSRHGDDGKPGFSTEEKNLFIGTLNDIFDSGATSIRFVGFPEGDSVERFEWMKHRFLQILNTHSQSVADEMTSEDCLKNKIVASILKVTKNVQNQIASHMPIDMTEQQQAASKSAMGEAAKHMCSDNPLSKFIMQTQNMIGKEVIGITAVGLKGFFGLSTYYGMLIEDAAKSNQRIFYSAAGNDLSGVAGIEYYNNGFHPVIANLNFEPLIEKALAQGLTEDSNEVKILRQVQKESRYRNIGTKEKPLWVPIDVALSISGLLSAATDNAKELILAKINATPELADIYIYLLAKGWTFNQIAKLMCSEAFTFATQLGEKNIFNLGSASYSVKKMIPFLLNKSDLPGARLDLIGGLLKTSDQKTIKEALTKESEIVKLIDSISETLSKLDEKKRNLRNMSEDALEQWRESQELAAEARADAEDIDADLDGPQRKQIEITPIDKMVESDLILALGQLELYLKRARFVANHDLKALEIINRYLPAVKEMSLVGQTFGINQGVKTNIRDFLNFADRISSEITNRFSEFARSLPKSTPASVKERFNVTFDFLRFLQDPEYQSDMIQLYGKAKLNFNVLSVFTTVPHFKEMLKAYGMTHDAFSTICSKFRVIDRINKSLKAQRINATEKDFKEIGNYVNDLYIHNFLESHNITFKIPSGQLYYLDIFGKKRINKMDGREIRLNSAEGAATFKNWVENYVIPTLKTSEEFGSEEFIKSLCTYETEYMGNVISGYTLPLQMMEIDKSINTQRIFEGILRSFDSISSKSFEDGMTLGEIFYLYNLIVNKDGFGQRSLTRIFENLINSRNFTDDNLINQYYQYIGNTDFQFGEFVDPEVSIDELIFRLDRYSSTFDKKNAVLVTYERPNPDFTFDLPVSTGWSKVNMVSNERKYSPVGYVSTIKTSPEELVYSIAEAIAERYDGSVEIITDSDLETMELPEVTKDMNAFIHNGKVYININSASSITDSLHEWAHLVFANMKYSNNPDLRNAYYAMLQKAANDPKANDPEFKKLYEGFAQGSDFLEEIVTYHIATYLQNKVLPESIIETQDKSILKSLAEIFGTSSEDTFLNHMFNTDLAMKDVLADICSQILTGTDHVEENLVLLSQKVASLKQELIRDDELDTKCRN